MKGLERSLQQGAPTRQEIVKSVVPFTGTITMTGATGEGWGTVVIGGLPTGSISLINGYITVTFTEDSDDISDTFNGDFSVGSTATEDATLDGTDVDIIPSTAILAADSVASSTVYLSATEIGSVLDNTGGGLECNLNLHIDDADIGADDDVEVEGVLTLVYNVV